MEAIKKRIAEGSSVVFIPGQNILLSRHASVSDPVQEDARLPAQRCTEVTAELSPMGVMKGNCSAGLDIAELGGRWARICLGTNRVDVTSSKMVQDILKLMDLAFVLSGQEVRTDRLLAVKFTEQMLSIRHPVWTSIIEVKVLPIGQAMVYTGLEW